MSIISSSVKITFNPFSISLTSHNDNNSKFDICVLYVHAFSKKFCETGFSWRMNETVEAQNSRLNAVMYFPCVYAKTRKGDL